MGLFHTHKWVTTAAGPYTRRLIWQEHGTDITLALRRCTECGKVEEYEIEGHWTKEQLNA
jgi:hypothetical protein